MNGLLDQEQMISSRVSLYRPTFIWITFKTNCNMQDIFQNKGRRTHSLIDNLIDE